MALIRVPQQSEADIEAWEREAQSDPLVARSSRHLRHVTQSVEALLKFLADGSAYVGVSWGKESTCVAHMVATLSPSTPLVCIVGQPIDNPHCALVRDEFLRTHPRANYHEIEVWCRKSDHDWHATGTMERGFEIAREQFGNRHVSGIRAAESAGRKVRMRHHGISSTNACAPIGWWSGEDVFAYLHAHDLPVHPSYAMSIGGIYTRARLRVAWLGLRHGDMFGRAEWEQRYYGWRFAELRAMLRDSR